MSTEAMKLALAALEETRNALAWFYDSYPQDVTKKGNKLLPHVETVLTTLREALAQPQQEPVEWQHRKPIEDSEGNTRGYSDWLSGKGLEWWPHRALYTSPPAQPQPLTDEQIETVWRSVQANDFHDCVKPFARAIEAAHNIKGDA